MGVANRSTNDIISVIEVYALTGFKSSEYWVESVVFISTKHKNLLDMFIELLDATIIIIRIIFHVKINELKWIPF